MSNMADLGEIEQAGRDTMADAPRLTEEQVARVRVLLDPRTAQPQAAA